MPVGMGAVPVDVLKSQTAPDCASAPLRCKQFQSRSAGMGKVDRGSGCETFVLAGTCEKGAAVRESGVIAVGSHLKNRSRRMRLQRQFFNLGDRPAQDIL